MILILALALFLVFCLLLVLTFRTAYYSPANRKEDPRHIPNREQYQQVAEGILALVDNIESYPFESVSIQSDDGLTLAGRYYHVRDKAPVVIVFHGYRSTAYRDGAGMFKLCMERGYNVLLPDMRAHGRSQGRVITLGVRERYDCLRWVEYLVKRFGSDTRILVSGCYGDDGGRASAGAGKGHRLRLRVYLAQGHHEGCLRENAYAARDRLFLSAAVRKAAGRL